MDISDTGNVVIRVKPSSCNDAENADNANPKDLVRDLSYFLLETYTVPRPKMIIRPNFCFNGILSHNRKGKGSEIIMISIHMLMILITRIAVMVFPHVPRRVGCQNLAKGRQMRSRMSKTPIIRLMTSAITAKTRRRNSGFVKIRVNRCKIESLISVLAIIQRKSAIRKP